MKDLHELDRVGGSPPGASPSQPPWTDDDRKWARKRIEKKHKLRSDVAAYVVVNLFLLGVWAVTGAGYFWPGWVLAGWAMLLLLDAGNLYYHRPITEDDIDRELHDRR